MQTGPQPAVKAVLTSRNGSQSGPVTSPDRSQGTPHFSSKSRQGNSHSRGGGLDCLNAITMSIGCAMSGGSRGQDQGLTDNATDTFTQTANRLHVSVQASGFPLLTNPPQIGHTSMDPGFL
ncbi:hypothetical protein SKAU_G00029420 [Synaphobranchus kaupii]|uniref:Uncharacterized protein n=1 Tax=Synaphobranchus kaupii TaxID=118154 RepID=A0A9Q1GER3_SYNKA|nr:hypothetical protein SKAU_G00029420 [Synaphobranchus kaupii]